MDDEQDRAERVVPVDFGFKWDVGAPEPLLVHSEDASVLLAHLRLRDASGHRTGIIWWVHCLAVCSGGPNEDGRYEHRLYRKGLADLR